MEPKKIDSDKAKKEKVALNLRHMREKDSQMVKGMFHYHEVPGGTLPFSLKIYAGDQVENYTLTDGRIVEIPLGVAKHLNKNGWYPEYSYVKTEDMQDVQKVTKKIRRFSFQSIEFMDIDDLKVDDAIPSTGL